MSEKGLEWNQTQLQIALELSKDKTCKDIIAEGKFHSTLVYKVAGKIEEGDKPPSLDEAYIAAAKPPTVFGSPQGKTAEKPEVTPAPKTAPAPKTPGKTTNSLSQTAILQFTPLVQQLPLTPNIFISYMCAVHRGYQGDIADWLSLVSLDFWRGRGLDMFAEVSGLPPSNLEKEGDDGSSQEKEGIKEDGVAEG